MNTFFCYEYRDGSGYKTRTTVCLAGILTRPEIESCLERGVCDDAGFIPSQVGLPDLQQQLADECQAEISENDHVWHSIVEIRPTPEAPSLPVTANEVKASFLAARDNWDIEAACDRTGVCPM
jgi:hypothetical protein